MLTETYLIYLVAAVLFLWRIVALSRTPTTLLISSTQNYGRSYAVLLAGCSLAALVVAATLPEMSWDLLVTGQEATVGGAIRYRQLYVLLAALTYAATGAAMAFLVQFRAGWTEKAHIRVSLAAAFVILTLTLGTAHSAGAWYARVAGTYLFWDPQTIARLVFYGLIFASFLVMIFRSFSGRTRRALYWLEVLFLSAGLLAKLVGGVLGTTGISLDPNPWL